MSYDMNYLENRFEIRFQNSHQEYLLYYSLSDFTCLVFHRLISLDIKGKLRVHKLFEYMSLLSFLPESEGVSIPRL